MTDCIFCKIINGEIPSYTVYENEKFKVMLDISPANHGHCLVIPKKHAANIFEIDSNELGEAYQIAKKVSEQISDKLNIRDINIVQNNGEVAGQTVDHFHIHVIPRLKDDNVDMKFGGNTLTKEDFEGVLNKLKF